MASSANRQRTRGAASPGGGPPVGPGGNPPPGGGDIEARLKKIYTKAKKELEEKLSDFEKKQSAKQREMHTKLTQGLITQEEYNDWMNRNIFRTDQWKQKVDQATGTLLDANRQAMQIINDEKMGVFADNANYQAYQLTKDTGMNLSFSIYDVDTVGRLIRKQPELLQRRKVNGVKDKAWNRTKIANAVSQGIIQGESIPEIAARIAKDTASLNGDAMLRYARTAITSAENAGRMETLHRAKDMGIKCKKRWLATLDSRTRDSHRDLDGQTVDIDEPFRSDLGTIMYPGDPSGEPGDVWNCRCTMTYVYEGYEGTNEKRIDNETKEHIKNMTYAEWIAGRNAAAATSSSASGSTRSYGAAVSKISAKYQQSVADTIANAPDNVRAVWAKHQSSLEEPLFDQNDPEKAFFMSNGDKRVHFGSEKKAYEKSSYQEENQCYFHEYGHNIDFLEGGGNKSYFSAQYQNGAFPKMIHQEIEETLRSFYLFQNPNADLWWEKEGFDFLLAHSSQTGQSIAQEMTNYFQVAQITMSKNEYRQIRNMIFNAGNDHDKLREIWEKTVITNSEVQKWFGQDKKSIEESGKRSTFYNQQNANSFAKTFGLLYNNYQQSDVSDMLESFLYPHFGIEMRIGHAHAKPGYWGTGKNINMEMVAAEAFAEMFSATATKNSSLDVIKKYFPKSYSIFEKMMEDIK